MLIPFAVSLLSALTSTAAAVERQDLNPNIVKLKRGIVDVGHDVPQTVGPNARSVQTRNPKFPSNYKDAKIVQGLPLIKASNPSAYDDVFKQSSAYTSLPSYSHISESQNNQQLSPYSGNLFTMSSGYKIAGDDFVKPLKQSGTNAQVPVFKTDYPLTKVSQPQIYAPAFQNKKASLPIFQVQKSQQLPSYSASFQNQPLILNPVDHRFNFGGGTPKVNNVQLGAPFLSPLSSFQGQVVPISTTTNNLQFPQYKGAAVGVYPTAGGFSTLAYHPLQTQPQLHFGHTNVPHVQPVDNLRHSAPAEEIRSDVEIIKKKKPTTPPPKNNGEDDDEDEDEDEGYTPHEKHYGSNSEDDDDYESKPGKHFKAPKSEGNFEPSTSFPFKEYDEKFSKYSNRNRDEDEDEKPFSKYREYSSSSDSNDDDHSTSGKYHSADTSSQPFYGRQENDEEDDDERQDYEKQGEEEGSDDRQRSKYFDKDLDEKFEASYRRELPKQRYVHEKEVPGVEYGSKSPKKYRDYHEPENPSNAGSRSNFKYYKNPQESKDIEGYSSDIITSLAPNVMYEGTFGYKIPRRNKAF